MHSGTNTDEEILVKTKQEPELFGLIIDRYENKLKRYLYRLTHAQNEDMEDMLQNIFLKVYSRQHSFDKSYSFSSWIYRISHNEAIDFLRRKNYRNEISLDSYEQYAPETENDLFKEIGEDFEITYDQEKDIQKIMAAVESLPAHYKEVLILRYFEEKDYEEMALILKKPKNTIGTLVHRAKQKMLDLLEKQK